ncbi:MAG: hypothetical protein CMM60_00030 [Rhodospirillaceae bacterium]|jgi:methionine synthase I (cobalamin-dependent)|nr:hypothetical protein [Rhodospirillaceae bacterium]|tara:strand:- start:3683 stop:4015 length:333 start_codon:yes stop_codon:yes gene_type:complete
MFVRTAVSRLQDSGADVVGAGCGDISPIGDSLAIVEEMRQSCDLPLAIKPNPGSPQLIDGKNVPTVTAEDFAEQVPAWIAAGASIIGGCCGATLEHLKAISSVAKGKTNK